MDNSKAYDSVEGPMVMQSTEWNGNDLSAAEIGRTRSRVVVAPSIQFDPSSEFHLVVLN